MWTLNHYIGFHLEFGVDVSVASLQWYTSCTVFTITGLDTRRPTDEIKAIVREEVEIKEVSCGRSDPRAVCCRRATKRMAGDGIA